MTMNEPPIFIRRTHNPSDDGRPLTIPPWLPNADLVAPCPCGQPLQQGQPYGVMEGETGMRRWMHAWCFASLISSDDEDE